MLKKSWFKSFIDLVYPNICPACDWHMLSSGERICIHCQLELPQTNYHFFPENTFTERFTGRLNVQAGAAYLQFIKGGKAQKMIHHIKYRRGKDLALYLGEIYGHKLRTSESFAPIHLILPVPLHKKKERRRGFNQSDFFAQGLSNSMGIPWDKKILFRSVFTKTQTEKSRQQRFDNVSSAFNLKNEHKIEGKHVLLVDDVLTTGATLEACGQLLLQVPNTKLSLATIAIAKY